MKTVFDFCLSLEKMFGTDKTRTYNMNFVVKDLLHLPNYVHAQTFQCLPLRTKLRDCS